MDLDGPLRRCRRRFQRRTGEHASGVARELTSTTVNATHAAA
jgi:hypothetical protein